MGKQKTIFVVRAIDNTDLGYALSKDDAEAIGKTYGRRHQIDEYPLNVPIDKKLCRHSPNPNKEIIEKIDDNRIYVVRAADNTDIGYALTFDQAKLIGESLKERWHIDEYPLNRIIDQRHRRTAHSTKQIICGREIPAFMLW